MSKLSLCEINQSQLDKTPIIDGQLVVCLDTGNAYRDTKTAHVKISSDLEVVSELPLAPLADKVYLLSPDKLYINSDNEWVLLNGENTNLDTLIAKLPVNNAVVLNDDVEIITQDSDTTQSHYYRRKLSMMWNYIKTKAEVIFATKDHQHTKSDITDFPTFGTAAAKNVGDFADSGHNHDSRYFTKEQVNSAIAGKADTGHTHDDRYYTEAEVDAKLTGVAASGHNHDDRYYTETEMDTKLAGKLHEETVIANIDADTIKTTGVYHLKGSTSNVPESGHCTLWVDATVGTVYQIFMHDSAYTAYKRVYTGGAWSAWTQLKFSDTTYGAATQSAAGLMSAADKKKLDNVAVGANAYSLPTATASVLGGVKTGSNITNSGGTISLTKANVTAALGYTPPTANTWRGVQDNLTSTATDQSLSANQGKVLKGLVDGKAASSHTHDDRYYTESEMNTKLNGKANTSHTHNYAGSGSAGGTANSVNGLTFAAQTTDPGAGSDLTTNKVLIVYT